MSWIFLVVTKPLQCLLCDKETRLWCVPSLIGQRPTRKTHAQKIHNHIVDILHVHELVIAMGAIISFLCYDKDDELVEMCMCGKKFVPPSVFEVDIYYQIDDWKLQTSLR